MASTVHYPEVIGGLFLTGTFILHSSVISFGVLSSKALQALEISALLWLCMASVGLGSLLWAQSRFQILTRLFVRHGLPLQSVLAHWTMVYGSLSFLSNVSLALVSMYSLNFSFGIPSFVAAWRLGIGMVRLFVFAKKNVTLPCLFIQMAQYSHCYVDTSLCRISVSPITVYKASCMATSLFTILLFRLPDS